MLNLSRYMFKKKLKLLDGGTLLKATPNITWLMLFINIK